LTPLPPPPLSTRISPDGTFFSRRRKLIWFPPGFLFLSPLFEPAQLFPAVPYPFPPLTRSPPFPSLPFRERFPNKLTLKRLSPPFVSQVQVNILLPLFSPGLHAHSPSSTHSITFTDSTLALSAWSYLSSENRPPLTPRLFSLFSCRYIICSFFPAHLDLQGLLPDPLAPPLPSPGTFLTERTLPRMTSSSFVGI